MLSTRQAQLSDKRTCQEIIFEAFGDYARRHNFPPEFSTMEDLDWVEWELVEVYCIMVQKDGVPVGMSLL